MLVFDLPDISASFTPPVVQMAATVAPKSTVYDGAIGTCQDIHSGPVTYPSSAEYDLAATSYSAQLIKEKFGVVVTKEDRRNAKVTLLNAPQHGRVVEGDDKVENHPDYHPNPDFTGKDRATFLVEIAGYKIRVEYYLRVGMNACPDDLASWRISSTSTMNSLSTEVAQSSLLNDSDPLFRKD